MNIFLKCISGAISLSRGRTNRCGTLSPAEVYEERIAALPPLPDPSRRPITLECRPTVSPAVPFLSRLPIEIRQKIYHLLLGGRLIHVLLNPDKLAHHQCTADTHADQERRCLPNIRQSTIPRRHVLPPSQISISLLRTCRQVYAEALYIVYSTNIFDFDDLSVFNHLAASIPSVGLASIKTIHLLWFSPRPQFLGAFTEDPIRAPFDDTTYIQFWNTLASQMPSLKSLTYHIEMTSWLNNLDTEVNGAWTRPLRNMHGLQTVNVTAKEFLGRRREPIEIERFESSIKSLLLGMDREYKALEETECSLGSS